MLGGHEEGHAEGYICSHRASGLDRHTNAQDQHNMICHESLDKAVSYRPYPDRFLISWVADHHTQTEFDLDWQASYAASWML